MSRKQKKKDAREQSTRQLMGIDEITDYSIATRMGELVFFIIKPTNISVLPDAGVGARIYALLNVVKGMAEIEMLALNSKESFENNKAFYRQRANEEELPVIRKLLEQDSKHLDRIQVLMASSREFYILVRLQGKKESDVFSYLSRIEKSIKDGRPILLQIPLSPGCAGGGHPAVPCQFRHPVGAGQPVYLEVLHSAGGGGFKRCLLPPLLQMALPLGRFLRPAQ